MSKVTNLQKTIYNCYLKNSRFGEPYKLRSDFSDIDPNLYLSLVKLSSFFVTYPHINIEEYFEAPRILHPEEKYPQLASFIRRSALKNYSLYQKRKEDRNPENQFDEIKDSFRFIGLFCISNKINLSNYIFFKQGYSYSWLDHYRQHRINPYVLFALGDIMGVISKIPKDELDLFASSLNENLIAFQNRYDKSFKTKQYCSELYKKVDNFVNSELTNSK